LLCHECRKNGAAFYVSAARQPLVGAPSYGNIRLGITFDQRHYLDLGKGLQHVLPLCADCARLIPEDQKWQFA